VFKPAERQIKFTLISILFRNYNQKLTPQRRWSRRKLPIKHQNLKSKLTCWHAGLMCMIEVDPQVLFLQMAVNDLW